MSSAPTPNLPTNIIPAKIRWLKLSGKFPMVMRIPPLNIQILFATHSLMENCFSEASPWLPPPFITITIATIITATATITVTITMVISISVSISIGAITNVTIATIIIITIVMFD